MQVQWTTPRKALAPRNIPPRRTSRQGPSTTWTKARSSSARTASQTTISNASSMTPHARKLSSAKWTCTGGLLTFGIGQINGIAVWRAIFLILGGITILWGVVVLIFLPDNILSARLFTPEDKALLVGRGRLARTGILNHQVKWYQIREAFTDPQVWIIFLFMLLNETMNGGIASFSKLIIKGLTGDSLMTVVLGIPFGAFQIFWTLSGTFLASRIPNRRTIVMVIYLLPTIIGVCIMWKLSHETQKIGVLFGYYIVGAYVCSLVLALQMPATNLGGYTKRVTRVALVFLAYCAGNIIGPHAFLAEEAPIYQTGCKVILSCSSGQAVLALCLRFLLLRRNKQRDAAAAASAAITADSGTAGEQESEDLTEFENPRFRYVL
ncbi:uncharacterized protein DSM5745_06507 [Aspergillus mulundensis]|uniref:Allantoate permease n=1 Tax=Aspergillus mulundensis TaxID=1810919 RepID=A0A3D8RR85_9EURO|nr:hypothetical protein DSM5745_06507 [Aspergillus mulundensis]RDW76515.1 hypothetical protein DSM5745_06507 [Aspergillus mulundensis]